jgi:type IV pilus assembly protein PilC
MLFIYKAIDQTGSEKAGTIEAVTLEVAIMGLQQRGFTITNIHPADEKGSILSKNLTIFERVSAREVVILSRQIATLFQAQVSALQIFKLLSSEQENPKLQKALIQVTEELQGGSSISGALSKHPDVFDSFYVNMVRSGEESGHLDSIFEDLASHLDRNYEVSSKAKNALIYPAFIIFTFFAVMTLMLTVVIPKISSILLDSGAEIPVYTKVVLGFSTFLVNYGVFVLIALIVSMFVLFKYTKTDLGKETFDGLKLKIPVLGRLFKMLYLSQISDNLYTMLTSGVPMIKSLELTRDIVNNRLFKIAIDDGIEMVKGGSTLSAAFAKHEVFPGVLVQMSRVGEETGKLGDILKTLAGYYRREVTNAVDTIVSLIEPFMIVFLGLGVGFLLASVLIPIYNVTATF